MDEKIMFWSPCVGLRPFVKPKKGELLKFRPASFETNVQQKRAPRSGGGGGGGGEGWGLCRGSGATQRVAREGGEERGFILDVSVNLLYIPVYIFIYIYKLTNLVQRI